MPQGMAYDFKGESRQFVKEGNTLAITFAIALLLIYLVLAAQFESFRDPFIILIGLPATVFGALFVLFILGEVNGAMQNNPPINLGSGTINIYTQIGLVTLIGLIAKHGILMVEFANKLQETKGYDKHLAIKEAGAEFGIADFGMPKPELDAIIDAGIAFRTSGCPGKFGDDISACDRPYGDSPPSNIASYPFPLEDVDIRKVRSQLDMDRPGERYVPGEEFEPLDD